MRVYKTAHPRHYFTSPAVIVRVRSCPAPMALAAGGLLLGALVLAYWSWAGRPSGAVATTWHLVWHLVLPLVLVWGLWLGVLGLVVQAWRNQPQGLLRWEAKARSSAYHWLWQDLAASEDSLPQALGRHRVLLDSGSQLWLLFTPAQGKRRWLCLHQRHNRGHWVAVRRAVYSPGFYA
ncbi:MAG: hypothetical protein KIG95_04260 [Comamonas sp.]|nr:hypothetical protein [Comamonas sp.]